MSSGSASVVIDRPADQVWAAITDITRMGEWSPECIAGRWVGPAVSTAASPVVGAKFEGDNVAKVAGRTVKKWTTTSEVTASEPGKRFEFCAEAYTNWRYELEAAGTGTKVTESFQYDAKGFQGFVYDKLLSRERVMTKGMNRTLARLKTALEAK